MASGYVGRIPSDPEGFTGWTYDALCRTCGRGRVEIRLMDNGDHIVRPHQYVTRDSTGVFTGKLADCPMGGKPYR